MGDLSQLNVSTASHRPGSSNPSPGVSLLVRQQLETKVAMVHSPDPTRRGERKRQGPHFCCTWRAPLFSDAERNEKQLSHALQPGYGCSDSSLCPDRLGEGRVYPSSPGTSSGLLPCVGSAWVSRGTAAASADGATLPGSCPDFTSNSFHTSLPPPLTTPHRDLPAGGGLGSLPPTAQRLLMYQEFPPRRWGRGHMEMLCQQPAYTGQDTLQGRAFCASSPNCQGH